MAEEGALQPAPRGTAGAAMTLERRPAPPRINATATAARTADFSGRLAAVFERHAAERAAAEGAREAERKILGKIVDTFSSLAAAGAGSATDPRRELQNDSGPLREGQNFTDFQWQALTPQDQSTLADMHRKDRQRSQRRRKRQSERASRRGSADRRGDRDRSRSRDGHHQDRRGDTHHRDRRDARLCQRRRDARLCQRSRDRGRGDRRSEYEGVDRQVLSSSSEMEEEEDNHPRSALRCEDDNNEVDYGAGAPSSSVVEQAPPPPAARVPKPPPHPPKVHLLEAKPKRHPEPPHGTGGAGSDRGRRDEEAHGDRDRRHGRRPIEDSPRLERYKK